MKLFKKRKKLKPNCYQLWKEVGAKDSGICAGIMPKGIPKIFPQHKIRICIGQVLPKGEKAWVNITPEGAIALGNVLQRIGSMVREIVEQKKELNAEDVKQLLAEVEEE